MGGDCVVHVGVGCETSFLRQLPTKSERVLDQVQHRRLTSVSSKGWLRME